MSRKPDQVTAVSIWASGATRKCEALTQGGRRCRMPVHYYLTTTHGVCGVCRRHYQWLAQGQRLRLHPGLM